MILTIRIPATPHRDLSPNSRKAERSTRPHKDAIKALAAGATLNTLNGTSWGCDGPIVLHIVYAWEASRRRMDWDNAAAISKAAIDGVFSRIDADDRQVVGLYVSQTRDPDGAGFMVITVEPQADERIAS